MNKLAISCHFSGTHFEPNLFLSRLTLKQAVKVKNSPGELKPFGAEAERGKAPYGYGSLTLLDYNVLGHTLEHEGELEEFIYFIAGFIDVVEEYGIEDIRLTLSVGYGQQGNFNLSRSLLRALAELGYSLNVVSYQSGELAAQQQKTLPSLPVIADELKVSEEDFIHLIKPHIVDGQLYK